MLQEQVEVRHQAGEAAQIQEGEAEEEGVVDLLQKEEEEVVVVEVEEERQPALDHQEGEVEVEEVVEGQRQEGWAVGKQHR